MNKVDDTIDMALKSDTKIQLKALTESFRITEDDVYTAVGLTPSDIGSDVADERVEALFKVCGGVRVWFDKPAETWQWFTSQTISGFGGRTPAAMIRDYDAKGGDALMQFIESKQLGGFE